MNSSLDKQKDQHVEYGRFWYRPRWQQYLVLPLTLATLLASGYIFIWKDKQNQLENLRQDNVVFAHKNPESSQFFAQNPTRFWIEQEMASLDFDEETIPDSQYLVLHLQRLVSHANVVLNQLQPTDPTNSHYQLEIQGKFKDLLEFMRSLMIFLPQPHWQFSNVIFTTKNQILTAHLSLSFIKDEQQHNEQH